MHATCPDFAKRFARHLRSLRKDAAELLPPEAAERNHVKPVLIGDEGWCIERRDCSALSLKECRERFIRQGQPVIITGLANALLSSECRMLAREWLRSELGMKVVAVRKDTTNDSLAQPDELLTIDEFCSRLDAGEALYLYDVSLPLQLPALLEHVRVPRYFAHCRLQRTRLRHCFDRSWPTLFIGAQGTRSQLHVDQWHGHFWMTVVSGSKHWSVWHPDDAHLLSPKVPVGRTHPIFPDIAVLEKSDDFTKARRLDFTLHEGETLFVPGGSPHFVVNAEDSAAFAGNFVDESNYDASLADMGAMASKECVGSDSAIAGVVRALDEVEWDPDDIGLHPELLQPAQLAVPYAEFHTGAAASWSAIPPNFE